MKKFIIAITWLITTSAWAELTYGPKTCAQIQADVCVDATPCKEINGITACINGQPLPERAVRVDSDCWQYQATFTCEDSRSINTCQPLRDKGCGQIGSTCLSTDPSARCVNAAFTFSCPDKPARTTQKTVCDTSFCNNDGSGCYDTASPQDKDFGQAASMIEVTRQAGIYGVDPGKIEIFKGYLEECSIKVLGGTELKSCCRSATGGAAYTNHALLSAGLSAGGAVVGQVGTDGIRAGSQYVYDALYGSTDVTLVNKGLSSINDWGSGLGNSSSFGAYGFQFSFSMSNGFSFVGFDPYSFAISIAINMIMEWLSCEPKEQTLMMKKGQNLCVYVGSYCAHKIPIINVCTEIKQQQCCFNSILAKIVNRQGRAQLGLPSNQCGGFNQPQLQALDFSRFDFTEFIASLHVDTVNNTSLNSKVNSTVLDKVKNYYEN